jgi:hypothetical protein
MACGSNEANVEAFFVLFYILMLIVITGIDFVDIGK